MFVVRRGILRYKNLRINIVTIPNKMQQAPARSHFTAGIYHEVDLRSDTITKPSKEMREAMACAVVGDDVFGEDPTVNELQSKMAALLGKEASLFVPSGTMGNLVSIMSHCNSRGLEVVLGHKSHIVLYEQGGIAQLGGVNPRSIPNKLDGTFCLDELKEVIRASSADPHQPCTRVVCLENTHNKCGGKVLPLDFIKQVSDVCRDKGILLHMDGARIFNAAAASSVPPSVIVEHCDSVNVCFSKGLGCPVGSIIVGSKEFIETAKRCRKVVGGGMRQVGILASAALYALEHHIPKLKDDHEKAKRLANAVMSADPRLMTVEDVHTNIIIIHFHRTDVVDSSAFCKRMQEVSDEEYDALGENIIIKMLPFGSARMARMVTHIDVSFEDVVKAETKLKYVIQEYTSTM